jgi:uncharacterized membrane protein (UPF0127 family)
MRNVVELRVPGRAERPRIGLAATWATRAIGLLATARLDDPCGLWITPCRSIHTCWMRYAIDVVFVDASGIVTKVVPRLKPWRMASCRRARSTLELRAGLAGELGIVPGVGLSAGRWPALTPAARSR